MIRRTSTAEALEPERVRAKTLQRRLHTSPDPDLEGLSPSEADLYKLRAKQRLHRLASELASVLGRLSNYDLAALWLESREKEGTIRCWKSLRDTDRYPRRAELDRLEHILKVKREERFGGAF